MGWLEEGTTPSMVILPWRFVGFHRGSLYGRRNSIPGMRSTVHFLPAPGAGPSLYRGRRRGIFVQE
jgi:hypothetical protein